MGTRESELSQDVVFDILSSPRRRYVLYYLRQIDGPIQLTDLAEPVAAWENDTEPSEVSDQERKRVYVSLYQTHIPRLEEAGLVEYDGESGAVTLTTEANAIDEYLTSSTSAIPWQQAYLLLAGLSVVLLGLAVVEAPVITAIPTVAIAFAAVLAFAVLASAHVVHQRRLKRSIPPELGTRD